MPLVSTRGAASAQGFGEFAQSAAPVYIEDVFSTWLYTGNSSTQTITNGIDLAGKGGLVWGKNRSNAVQHALFDTVRGQSKRLATNLTSAEVVMVPADGVIKSFNSNGFTLDVSAGFVLNDSGQNYVSWTFRKQPKFFDIVTYTGTGSSQNIAHNLGSVPGCIIVKRLDTSSDWSVYHRSTGASSVTILQSTTAAYTDSTVFNSTPTATTFTVRTAAAVNASGGTYVAYLFAHDAGGFGLTGTDNVISCGFYTGNGSTTGPVVTLGYEPQWLMIKNATTTGPWAMYDNMRGLFVGPSDARLLANTAGAETAVAGVEPTATGFSINSISTDVNGSGSTYIYIAIRRGPMKVPTTGTSVFLPATRSGNSGTNTVSGPDSKPVDTVLMTQISAAAVYPLFWDRLRGRGELTTNATSPELFPASSSDGAFWDVQQGMKFVGSSMDVDSFPNSASFNASGVNHIDYRFRRAPSFFDEVCYTGTGSASQTINHNLSVVPELVINKSRSGAARNWTVNYGSTTSLRLNLTNAAATDTSINLTSTTFDAVLGSGAGWNASGVTYVTYLFATCPGVSKVGSFTGTGATQVINCGFTGGARFVLIKATSEAGHWMVWDSARGIVAGNDPYLRLNSTAAEVTNTDWVDTAATGFELSNAGGNLANSNGVSYIFLAIS